MENLYHIKCHRIIDNQQEEAHAEIVECFHKKICFVVFIGQGVLEIPMYAINGDKDILKDNGFNFVK
tara:strand:- start:1388 stop:1588 length:201 start_codon:yes stop_codon:yes gene_type:complete